MPFLQSTGRRIKIRAGGVTLTSAEPGLRGHLLECDQKAVTRLTRLSLILFGEPEILERATHLAHWV